MLAHLLQRRFGDLNPMARARLAEGDAESLERWVERVLTAESLDAVFDD